uniref:Uncharacterized protein n=1 Tax=Vespula pensylvanica TaxID=30213 RepID=A0A834PFD9_VESPE|nr:hypothetical protein H0235_001199 [Vespula pensylvanica]
MMMVDACGSAATETVASISSHVTRVSMYFAVGIGCLPLKLIVRRVVRRVPMMPQAIVPVPSVLEKGSKRAREASDGTQKVQLRVHILYYRFPRAKSEWNERFLIPVRVEDGHWFYGSSNNGPVVNVNLSSCDFKDLVQVHCLHDEEMNRDYMEFNWKRIVGTYEKFSLCVLRIEFQLNRCTLDLSTRNTERNFVQYRYLMRASTANM